MDENFHELAARDAEPVQALETTIARRPTLATVTSTHDGDGTVLRYFDVRPSVSNSKFSRDPIVDRPSSSSSGRREDKRAEYEKLSTIFSICVVAVSSSTFCSHQK